MSNRLDGCPDGLIWLAAAVGALIATIAVLGYIDMDDTKTNAPVPAPVYQHPEEGP